MPAATAAAEPPDEPPGGRVASHGLRAGPNVVFSFDEHIANSSMFALPIATAWASLTRSTTAASYGGTKLSSMREAQVVRRPLVQKMSLWANGMPVSEEDAPACSR